MEFEGIKSSSEEHFTNICPDNRWTSQLGYFRIFYKIFDKMKGVGLCVALLTLVVFTEAKYYKSSNYYSKCAMYHNGCEYQVTLSPGQCGYASDSTGFTIVKSQEISSKSKNYNSNTINTQTNSDKLEIEKLDHLERKLTKMLEGLSIRSLRHIRGIRKELGQMANSISLLQHSAPSKNGRSAYGRLGPMQYTCPPEFVRAGTWTSCYRFSNFNATWNEAREYCAAFGANLVALDTLQESYIMDYIIKSNSGKQLFYCTFTLFLHLILYVVHLF